MMSRDISVLRERRARLIARAAEQRAAVGRLALACAAPLRMAAVGAAVVCAIRRRPGVVILLSAAVVVLRPSRILRWTVRVLPVVLTLRSWARRVAGTRPHP